MEKGLTCLCLLVLTVRDACGFKIRNKLLNKCLQVNEGSYGGRVSLAECNPDSYLQEWSWLEDGQALSSQHTGECLTAPREQYEGVYLQACVVKSRYNQAGEEAAAQAFSREASSQAWTCSKKGHLTLISRGLHLNAAQESTLVFLSREHKQGSRWQNLDHKTLCNGKDDKHIRKQSHHHPVETLNPQTSPGYIPDVHREVEAAEVTMSTNVTESHSITDLTTSSLSTKSPTDPSVMFYNMVYGMGWKITMLVLSSLALIVGIAILIVSLYFNHRKKVVCVLKSYTPRPEVIQGSPGRSDTAPLTEHAMRLPYSSPAVQQGEILIEWKDGSVTPLYEA
ncbi:uncharacterized protein LOC115398180 [Salarias fasciatus]|uniref:Uncharacterized LOC115398180 n=1 Tax=Salarias fasciatus TaxID=181472 RepID=A0A672JKG8_SALFA|nr:uncharacterized protein LOC115398180 [Salarias fasciatus]